MRCPKIKKIFSCLFFLIHFSANAQTSVSDFKSEFFRYPINAKLGMCNGYHIFWVALSKAAASPQDMRFSINVSKDLQSRYGQNHEFDEYTLQTLKNLNAAIANNNTLLVKQIAGVCHELGYPVGQRTNR